MKQFKVIGLAMISVFILGACSTSNEVVGGGIFQKRKHTGGVYWDRTEKVKASKEVEEEEFDIFRLEEESQKKYVTTTTIHNQDNAVATTETDAVYAASESDELIEETVEDRSSTGTSVATTEDNNSSSKDNTVNEKKSKKLVKDKKSNAPAGGDAMFILAVILAILIPPLGVLIYTNIDWMKVLICLLLTILFFLPGMIYALLVVFDVI